QGVAKPRPFAILSRSLWPQPGHGPPRFDEWAGFHPGPIGVTGYLRLRTPAYRPKYRRWSTDEPKHHAMATIGKHDALGLLVSLHSAYRQRRTLRGFPRCPHGTYRYHLRARCSRVGAWPLTS